MFCPNYITRKFRIKIFFRTLMEVQTQVQNSLPREFPPPLQQQVDDIVCNDRLYHQLQFSWRRYRYSETADKQVDKTIILTELISHGLVTKTRKPIPVQNGRRIMPTRCLHRFQIENQPVPSIIPQKKKKKKTVFQLGTFPTNF